MNLKSFYDAVRPIFPGGILTSDQVTGMGALLDAFAAGKIPLDQQAYMLATVFHESGHTMQPVRETFARSDDEAIRNLDRAFARGQLHWVTKPYWRRDAEGKAWFGRGFPQITHKVNYAKLSAHAGVDLVADPDQALKMPVAIKILIAGMQLGLFTGKDLGDYLDGVDESDAEDLREFTNARRIVNGTDRAALIGQAALTFEHALKGALS